MRAGEERHPEGQWPRVARLWEQLGSPLRPVDADLAAVRYALKDWCATHPEATPRGVILGVTPELCRLPWPDPAQVVAVDRTLEMIAHVWPGDPAQVICADWRSLPLAAASADFAACDGGLHLLDFPSGQLALFTELARAVAPGGLVVLRLFTPPAKPETVERLLETLFAGGIRDVNCLKLRLGMALQASPESGVALQDVWRTLHSAAGDWSDLAARLGWDIDQLLAIDAYRDSPARYHFVSEAMVVDLSCSRTDGAFEPVDRHVPTYAMGDQCPTLVLRRTRRGPTWRASVQRRTL